MSSGSHLDRGTHSDPSREKVHVDKAVLLGCDDHAQSESVPAQGVHCRFRSTAQPIDHFSLRARPRPSREGTTRSRTPRQLDDAVAVVGARHEIARSRAEGAGLVAERRAAAQRCREHAGQSPCAMDAPGVRLSTCLPAMPSRTQCRRAESATFRSGFGSAIRMSSTRSRASPKSIWLLSRKKSGFWTPAFPVFMERLKTTTLPAPQT